MTATERWLRERLDAAPPALLASMVAALPNEGGPVPDDLIESALALYGRVARGSGGREDALPLLAADALLTHAFEAQADLDPTGIVSLSARCDRGLGEALP